MSMESYKAMVIILGAVPQNVYGKKRETLLNRAIALLTEYEPGWGSCTPLRVELFVHVKQVSGNRAEWKPIQTVKYEDVPQGQLKWLARKISRSSLGRV